VAYAGGPEESHSRITQKPGGVVCNLAPISYAIGNEKGHQATEGISSHSHAISNEQRPSLHSKRPAHGVNKFLTED